MIWTHGKPKNIRCDNGPEFISHIFQEWCRANEIKIKYTEPGRPTQNSYIERFNGSYRRAVLDAYVFRTLEEVREQTEKWLNYYNNDRPHEAFGKAKAGRAVRIATIPRPEGQDKIDVNALVAARGPEALKEVLARAVDPGSHLISRIPADAPAQTVSAAFGEILDAVACTDPVVRQGWLDLAKERFGIKGEALKALKARVFPSKNMTRGESSASGRTFLSEVDGTYWAADSVSHARGSSRNVVRRAESLR